MENNLIDNNADERKSAQPSVDNDAPQQKVAELVPRTKFPLWSDLFIAVGIYVISEIVGSFAGLLMMGAQAGAMSEAVGNMPPEVTCVVYVIRFLPVILYLIFRRVGAGLKVNLPVAFKKINPPMVLWGVLLVMISGVVIEPLLELFPDKYIEMLSNALGSGVWALVCTVILAPIFEETLFRGLVLGACREKLGALPAVIISAFVFGVVHIIPQQVVNAFVVGLILGYIYVSTGSLAAVVTIHAINNAIAWVSMELFGADQPTLREILTGDTVYYIVYGLCLVIFVVSMVKLVVSLKNNSSVEAETE